MALILSGVPLIHVQKFLGHFFQARCGCNISSAFVYLRCLKFSLNCEGHFARYRILDRLFFPSLSFILFNTLNILAHCLLDPKFLVINLLIVLLRIPYMLRDTSFLLSIRFFVFDFKQCDDNVMMCFSFSSSYLEILFLECSYSYFSSFGNFSTIFFLFSVLNSLLLLGRALNAYVDLLDVF